MSIFGKSDDTRISILETQFVEFQNQMVNHMSVEELSFSEVKSSLKDIIVHIDVAQKDNEKALDNMKGDVLRMIDKEYVSKLDLRDELTNQRTSIVADIKSERRSATRDLVLVCLGFAAAMGLGAWLYINVIKKDKVVYRDSHIEKILGVMHAKVSY